MGGPGRVGHVVGHVWSKKENFGAKTGVGHWIGHIDGDLGVGRAVCTKRQLFGKTNTNTNYLSVGVSIFFMVLTCDIRMVPIYGYSL